MSARRPNDTWVRFRDFALAHGVTLVTKALYHSYEEFCAANPGHWACGSKASMEAFFGQRGTGRAAAAARTDVAAAVAPPAQFGYQNLRISHKIRCEGEKLVVSGTDLIATISTPATCPGGTNLLTFPFAMSSQALASTRMRALSQLYEKYDLRKVTFYFQPATATSVNGSIVMAWDNDPTDEIVAANDAGLRQLYSYRSNASGSVWAPITLPVKLDKSTLSLFTSPGDDPRLFTAGLLQVAAAANVPTSTTLGTVWMSYEVALSSPSELSAGPTDLFAITMNSNNITYVAAGNMWHSVASVGGVLNVNGGIPITAYGGYATPVLTPGQWLYEIECLNEIGGGAIGTVTLGSTVLDGSPVLVTTVTGSIVKVPVASAGTSVFYRIAFVITGSGSMGVWPVMSVGNVYAVNRLAIKTFDGQLTTTGVDSWPF